MERWTPSLIGPKRRFVQWTLTILVVGVPFLRVGGESVFRLDAPSRTLLFFGARLRIEEFWLFLDHPDNTTLFFKRNNAHFCLQF